MRLNASTGRGFLASRATPSTAGSSKATKQVFASSAGPSDGRAGDGGAPGRDLAAAASAAHTTRAADTLKYEWSVPRNSIHHYPEETRQRMMHELNAKYRPESDPLLAKCRQALEYERQMGYVDFIGRNGDCFSRWISQQLSRPEFTDGGVGYAHDASLVRAMEELYGGMGEGERAKVVAAVGEWLDGWQAASVKRADSRGGDAVEEVKKPRSPVKQSTIDFRSNFMETAMQSCQSPGVKRSVNALEGEQRTELWKSLRESRLTASAFSKALGFFPGDRVSLWEEKIGVREPFKGNDATRWGTKSEARALMTYERLTGQQVESCMFKVKKDDVVHDWLGASPDGLVAGLGLQASEVGEGPGRSGGRSGGWSGSERVIASTPGILEVKCPYNKGAPELGEPPKRAIWYYMPQIQGLMDVFDREWCALYVWTPARGSSSFIISRDRAYWSACFDVLAEFWWSHTVPARQLRADEGSAGDANYRQYCPSEEHEKSHMLVEWSKQIAWSSPGKVYPHLPID